jgi:hypothetical protein
MHPLAVFLLVWGLIGLTSFLYYNFRLNLLPMTISITLRGKPWTYIRWCFYGILLGPLMYVAGAVVYGIASTE